MLVSALGAWIAGIQAWPLPPAADGARGKAPEALAGCQGLWAASRVTDPAVLIDIQADDSDDAAEATAAAPAPAPAGSPVKVRFAEPGGPALLAGPVRITIEAQTSDDARIVRVSLSIDGALLSVLETPPYTLTWDAGRGAAIHTLKALAEDSAGRQGEAVLTTRPLAAAQYEDVRLVTVYAAVRDARGRPVLDLPKEAFTLQENGVRQTITTFAPARVPITVALLVDTSSSMRLGGRIDLARKGAIAFVDAMSPDDRLLVMHFDDRLYGGDAPAVDRKAAKEQLEAITPGGGTALYDALYTAADRLTGIEGRRAIVLLSDGRDQALTENEPGSLHLFEEALERVQRSDAAVYAIGLGHRLDQEMDLEQRRSLKDMLDVLARQTGGRSYFPEHPGVLEQVYRQVASDLKDQYLLAYASTNTAHDGKWRSIAVTLKDPALHVTARSGYFAPGAAS
jgi:VWFA-related protein